MPIDPFTALNAMLRAEVSRFTPPVRKTEPVEPVASGASVASESEHPQHKPSDPAA